MLDRKKLTDELSDAINEAISTTLENAVPCPQQLVNEHFSMWRMTPNPIPVRGLDVAAAALELAQKVAGMAADEIEAREDAAA